MKRVVAALSQNPWAVAFLAAAGVALLVPSSFALLAPPELLDAAVALGDQRLYACVAALFAGSLLVSRAALWWRRSPEDDAAEQAAAPVVHPGAHLR